MRKLPTESLRLLVLTGFMGAGKSTVGALLAERLGWPFVDADMEMEAATGTTIAELFTEHGEAWFRELEHRTIVDLADVTFGGNLVLALGGGAIEDVRTRNHLLKADATLLIHLEASLETVLARCQGTDDRRPILADRANLEARYLRRLPLYRESHFTVAVDSLSPEGVVDFILKTRLRVPQSS